MLLPLIAVIAILFFLYFLSCSIIFAYQKLKKRSVKLASAFVLVVISILVLFILVTPTPPSRWDYWSEREKALEKVCTYLHAYGCNTAVLDSSVKGVDLDRDKRDDSIREVCRFVGIGNDTDCLRNCWCP